MRSLSFMCCRRVPKIPSCLKNFLVAASYYIKQVKKNRFSNLGSLNQSSVLSETKQLKIRTKNPLKFTRMSTNTRGLGNRQKVAQANVITFICITTSSSRNVKSMHQFSFKSLIQYSFRSSIKYGLVWIGQVY